MRSIDQYLSTVGACTRAVTQNATQSRSLAAATACGARVGSARLLGRDALCLAGPNSSTMRLLRRHRVPGYARCSTAQLPGTAADHKRGASIPNSMARQVRTGCPARSASSPANLVHSQQCFHFRQQRVCFSEGDDPRRHVQQRWSGREERRDPPSPIAVRA
jgi:hypothetical protein